MIYSDDVVFGNPGDAKTLVDAYAAHPEADAILMAQTVAKEVVDKYGIISFKEGSDNELDNIIEKPDLGSEPSQLASYGRYLLKPSIFEYLNPSSTGKDGELWTVDAITEVAKRGKVLIETTKGEWMTTGDPENYFRAHLKYVLEKEKYGGKVLEWLNEFKSS